MSASGRAPCWAARPSPGTKRTALHSRPAGIARESLARPAGRDPGRRHVPLVVRDDLDHQSPIQTVGHQPVCEIAVVEVRIVGRVGQHVVQAELALQEVRGDAQQGHVRCGTAPLLPCWFASRREEVAEGQVGQMLRLAFPGGSARFPRRRLLVRPATRLDVGEPDHLGGRQRVGGIRGLRRGDVRERRRRECGGEKNCADGKPDISFRFHARKRAHPIYLVKYFEVRGAAADATTPGRSRAGSPFPSDGRGAEPVSPCRRELRNRAAFRRARSGRGARGRRRS